MPLAKASHEEVDWFRYLHYSYGRIWTDRLDYEPVHWYYEDLDDSTLYIAGKPQEVNTLDLAVLRGLTTEYSYNADATIMETQTFEIKEQHHPSLLLWVCHLAYLKRGADTYDERCCINIS